jgi:putative ABC transport system substrate-binding protein
MNSNDDRDPSTRRRKLVFAAAIGSASIALPTAAFAQPVSRTVRIGFLYFGSRQPGPGAERYAAFLAGMRDLGYVEGKNLQVEARFADSNAERIADLVKELLALKVDVIVATASPTYRALQRLNTSVPIVVTVTADPLLEGLATTVARPGGLFTGLADTAADLSAKQIELLKDVIPRLSRVGAILNPSNASHPAQATRMSLAGQRAGTQVVLAEAGSTAEIEPAFASLARLRAEAVILFGDTFFSEQMRAFAQAALNARLASVYIPQEYAALGGLMSYGAALVDNFRRAATNVDKILTGAAPGDLPFEYPTEYLLAINLRTAKALGLTIPQSLLLRANQRFD